MAEDSLLEALVRPDDLTSFVEQKEIKFLAEHRAILLRLESTLNPFPASTMVGSAGDPVHLSLQGPDRVHPPNLVRTSDDPFNKIMVCLMTLCEEVVFLRGQAEGKFFTPLYFFGHTQNDDLEDWSDGLLEAQVGLMLPLLQEAQNFVVRVGRVVHSLVRQVRALLSGKFAGGFKEIKLGPVVCSLGDALRVLITLDTIIAGNRQLGVAWQKYKRLADIIRSDPGKFGHDSGAAGKFFELLSGLDQGLLQGKNFGTCIDQAFETPEELRGFLGLGGGAGAGKGTSAPPLWVVFFRETSLERMTGALGGVGGELESNESLQVVGQLGVYALYRVLVGGRASVEALSADFYSLWKGVCERCPLIVLWGGGRVVLKPEEFLLAHCNPPGGVQSKKLVPRDPTAVRAAASDSLEASLPALANTAHARLLAWLVRAGHVFSDSSPSRLPPFDEARARCFTVTQGLALAYSLQRTLSLTCAFTVNLSRPMKRKTLAPLARICELLKVIEATLSVHAAPLASSLPHVLREHAATLVEALAPLRLKSGLGKAGLMGSEVSRFMHASSELVLDLCTATESWSPARRVLLELALSGVCQKEGLATPAAISKVGDTVWAINFLSEHASHTAQACSTASLYFLRDLFPAMISSAVTVTGDAPHDLFPHHGSRLPFLFAALSDPAKMLARVVHLHPPPPPTRRVVRDGLVSSGAEAPLFFTGEEGGGGGEKPAPLNPATPAGVDKGLEGVPHLLTSYERYLHGILRADLIQPIAAIVEKDLRERAHAAQGTHKPSNLVSKPPIVYLLSLPPFRVISAVVDFRLEVTQYLEKTFYELSTIALHDWKT